MGRGLRWQGRLGVWRGHGVGVMAVGLGLARLAAGPASVSQLSQPFAMARPTFLKHLQVLEGAGIVTSEKTGRVRTVSLSPDALDWVEAWVHRHRLRWERRLDDVATLLDKENNA